MEREYSPTIKALQHLFQNPHSTAQQIYEASGCTGGRVMKLETFMTMMLLGGLALVSRNSGSVVYTISERGKKVLQEELQKYGL